MVGLCRDNGAARLIQERVTLKGGDELRWWANSRERKLVLR